MPPKLSLKEQKKFAKLKEEQRKASEQAIIKGMEVLEKVKEEKPLATNLPHYKAALVQFQEALRPGETDKTNAEAYHHKAKCHKILAEAEIGKTTEWEVARDAFTEAETILKEEPGPAGMVQPMLPEVYSGRAYCWEQLDEWDKAIQDYTSVIEIMPDDDHAYNCRGHARGRKRTNGMKLKQVDFKFVIDDLTRAIELNESNYYAYANRGSAYFDHQDYRKAIEDYSRAMYVKDIYDYMLFRRAVAYYECVLQERALEAGGRLPAAARPDEKRAGAKTQEELWEEEFWAEERVARAKEQQDDFLQQSLKDLEGYIKKTEAELGQAEIIPALKQRVMTFLEIGTDETLDQALQDCTAIKSFHEKAPKETEDLKKWHDHKRQVIRERKEVLKQQGGEAKGKG